MGVREMLDTVSLEPTFDVGQLGEALQALSELDRDSTACGTAMTAEDDAASMVTATRADHDCADIAHAAHRVLSRAVAPDVAVVRPMLEVAIAAATRSATECGRHAGHHGHCRVHVESANRAIDACRALLKSLPG